MYTHLMVPLDGSDASLEALPMAVAVARLANARIELVHVYDAPPRTAAGHVLSRRLDDDEQELVHAQIDGTATVTARQTGLNVTATFLSGDVVPVLRDHARASGSDLIVMTTHGRGGVSRMWFGSVAEGILGEASVPVLLVRPGLQSAASRSTFDFRRILVPLEHSRISEEILPHARALATPGTTELVLLTVVDPRLASSASTVDLRLGATPEESLLDTLVATAEERLERLSRKFRAEGLMVRTEVTIDPAPAQCILRSAQTSAVELIALVTHARRGVERLLLGATADKITRGAYCPILVARPHVASPRESVGSARSAVHTTSTTSRR